MHAASAAWRDFECTEAVGAGTGAIRSVRRGRDERSRDRYEKRSCTDSARDPTRGDEAVCASIRARACVTAGFRWWMLSYRLLSVFMIRYAK
ncbi:TPA: hypothetical protein QDE31_35850 [Burkholderia cenocepacia]|nr:hypothetical protein [Burkholderia cenocepacia]HDR9879891.1 hypothetical protein [Burkholderia cenocepacia]HDR9886980.1 hypothetical protein [Burkholderia cenocepacia]